MRLFHICTIVNNQAQYQAMIQSFESAGFDEKNVRYTMLDNCENNKYEPYSSIRRCMSETAEPYLIFCHQDLLANQGHGIGQLKKAIEELDELDSSWAVAGNAGVNGKFTTVAKITDRYKTGANKVKLPQKVHSLDENFLIFNQKNTFTFNQCELRGFHFYGTELCLSAIEKSLNAYVIDFHLEHLGRGAMEEDFYSLRQQCQQAWGHRFRFCFIQTTTNTVFFSTKLDYQFLPLPEKTVAFFLKFRPVLRRLKLLYFVTPKKIKLINK